MKRGGLGLLYWNLMFKFYGGSENNRFQNNLLQVQFYHVHFAFQGSYRT